MTQAELDLARLACIVASLQFSVSEAIAKMDNQFEHAAMCKAYREQFETLANQIGTGELRGDNAGEA